MSSTVSDRSRRSLPPTDIVVLSLLILCMTFVIVQFGLWTPVGGLALLLQAGILIRLNVVHRNASSTGPGSADSSRADAT